MKLAILITSAGRRVGLLQCFRRAAERAGLDLEVLACDLQPELSAACHAADRAFAVPRVDNPGYCEAVLEIVKAHAVQLVVPTIDPELEVLSSATERFVAAGCRVHVSSPDTVAVARDKRETARILAAHGLHVPKTFDLDDVLNGSGAPSYPLFLKPRGGSASRGLAVIRDRSELPRSMREPMILQELLVGPEYTTNMFIDSNGIVRCIVPHLRIRIRAGEVEKGQTERRADLDEIGLAIARALPSARGALCFQTVLDERHGMVVFEINARFGGGYPLADHAGAEFASWLLQEVCGEPCSAHNDWREGVLMLRYDAAIFEG